LVGKLRAHSEVLSIVHLNRKSSGACKRSVSIHIEGHLEVGGNSGGLRFNLEANLLDGRGSQVSLEHALRVPHELHQLVDRSKGLED